MLIPAVAKYLRLRSSRWFRAGDAGLLLLAIAVGVAAGVTTIAQGLVAHGLQRLFFGIGINRLSGLASITHPWRLVALPAGGMLVGALHRWAARRHAPVDVVEANALHGGRIPAADTGLIAAQTIASNGFGASVGLEATYTQVAGWIASVMGHALLLRRADMRTLVGAGAGAAIAAAFGAPLTGAFYAFEVVIGTYAPAALAPVAAAALAAALVTRRLGIEPYLIVVEVSDRFSTADYLLYAGLGVVCALFGIAVMQVQALAERQVSRMALPPIVRGAVGGLLLAPIAWITPQALSAGHGALHFNLAMQPGLRALCLVLALKVAASIISLSFGYRGGLFFASLFLGSLLGPIFADAVNMAVGHTVLPALPSALVGMAALAVTVVGGPLTMAMLVLEATQNFALTGVVIAAVVCASAFTRARFGYSFSTWRLHLRGSSVRSPRDIGWVQALTAHRLMRRDPTRFDAARSIGEFRRTVPLGATSRVLLVDAEGRYQGIVATAQAYDPRLDEEASIATLARLVDQPVAADTVITEVLDRFEALGTEDLAVVGAAGEVIGVLTEKYVSRRYIEESDKTQSQLYGE